MHENLHVPLHRTDYLQVVIQLLSSLRILDGRIRQNSSRVPAKFELRIYFGMKFFCGQRVHTQEQFHIVGHPHGFLYIIPRTFLTGHI